MTGALLRDSRQLPLAELTLLPDAGNACGKRSGAQFPDDSDPREWFGLDVYRLQKTGYCPGETELVLPCCVSAEPTPHVDHDQALLAARQVSRRKSSEPHTARVPV